MGEIKNTNLSEEELRLILKNAMIMESSKDKMIKILKLSISLFQMGGTGERFI